MRKIVEYGVLVAFAVSGLACDTEAPSAPARPDVSLQDAQAPIRVNFAGFPFYARIEGSIPIADGYGIVYFYVQDPSVVPDNFNLLDFFDPAALGLPLSAWAIDGFLLFSNAGDPIPNIVHSEGKGAVPFWFVPEAVAIQLQSDGVVTVPELEAANPIKGFATYFVEELHAAGQHPQPGLKVSARGELVGGGTFKATGASHLNNNGEFTLNATLRLDFE